MIPPGSLRFDILKYSQDKFHTKPIYPWTLLPEYAVLRHEGSLKWFALFMNVDGQRLGLTPGRIYDVIDLRCEESDIPSYLEKKGFLPAFHMSKKNWVTILLDGSVSLDEIKRLLDESYEITRDRKDFSADSNGNQRNINTDSYLGSDTVNKSISINKSIDYHKSIDIDYPKTNGSSDYSDNYSNTGNVVFTGTYKDQPLSFGGRRHVDESLPPRIAEMKALYNVIDSRPGADGYYFYKQGKFMEDYEESYDFHGRFMRFFPTYHVMNNDQLRGYFDFRRRIREGDTDTNSISFVYVYLYELLCNIGVSDPEDGFRKILHIDEVFGKIDTSMHDYIKEWLIDYVVYYDLPVSLLDGIYDNSFDDSLSTLFSYEKYILEVTEHRNDPLNDMESSYILKDDESTSSENNEFNLSEEDTHKIFEAIDALSSYSLSGSLFYRKNPKDMEEIAVRTYRAISLFYQEHDKPMLLEKCFGARGIYPYHMFRKALFYDHIKYDDYEYRFSASRIYRCKEGHWSVETYREIGGKSSDLGAICREIDRLCRRKFSFGHPLQQKLNLPLVIQAISDEIDAYIREKEEAARPKIHIDFDKLSGIRKDAAYTREQLITKEEMSDEDEFMAFDDEVPSSNSKPAAFKDVTNSETAQDIDNMSGDDVVNTSAEASVSSSILSEHQMNIVNLLLSGGSVSEYVSANHLMLSIEIDAINEAMYDEIGDTVIEFDGESPSLVEDYIEDIKEILGI